MTRISITDLEDVIACDNCGVLLNTSRQILKKKLFFKCPICKYKTEVDVLDADARRWHHTSDER